MSLQIDQELLRRFDCPIPRYTSYPTAPEWHSLSEEIYRSHLSQFAVSGKPTSVYIHIPFCKTMCLYCACSVVLNRLPEREVRYVDYLMQELTLVRSQIGRPLVRQLHFGGGTPTQLSESLLDRLMKRLNEELNIDWEGEISIEIDPRTVTADEGRKLRTLRSLGFNRVSFGVQDTNPIVGRAVRRHQSYAMTSHTYYLARELGFCGVNIDLIYGLPHQTQASFHQTVEDILLLRPDRIAFFSYAQVPWLKPHQKAIPANTLPSTEEKFAIYLQARESFMRAGYIQIGMDHFALEQDSLVHALRNKQLQRNFQGYSLKLAEDLIGLGITATGFVGGCYVQNLKSLEDYYKALDSGLLPTFKGRALTSDDHIRRWTIQKMMCDFSISAAEFEYVHKQELRDYFTHEWEDILSLQREGLIEIDEGALTATSLGRLFIRNVASTFDAYLHVARSERRFSQGI